MLVDLQKVAVTLNRGVRNEEVKMRVVLEGRCVGLPGGVVAQTPEESERFLLCQSGWLEDMLQQRGACRRLLQQRVNGLVQLRRKIGLASSRRKRVPWMTQPRPSSGEPLIEHDEVVLTREEPQARSGDVGGPFVQG